MSTRNDRELLAKLSFAPFDIHYHQYGTPHTMQISTFEWFQTVGDAVGKVFPTFEDIAAHYHKYGCSHVRFIDGRGMVLYSD